MDNRQQDSGSLPTHGEESEQQRLKRENTEQIQLALKWGAEQGLDPDESMMLWVLDHAKVFRDKCDSQE